MNTSSRRFARTEDRGGQSDGQRSAQKGITARKVVVLDDEEAAAFQAFRAAPRDELAPDGILQHDLATPIALRGDADGVEVHRDTFAGFDRALRGSSRRTAA